jgi:hypothetical protein
VEQARLATPDASVEAVVERAVALLDSRSVQVDGQRWRADCSGFVTCAWSAAELDLTDPRFTHSSITTVIWRTMEDRGLLVDEPARGDLVFFDDTTDRNNNGLRDDPLTHIGLVEELLQDGTVVFLHFGSGRVKRDRLSLDRRDRHTHPETDEVLNSYIRRGSGGERLAGQLLRGFARPAKGAAQEPDPLDDEPGEFDGPEG